MGASILPITIYKGKIYFLFGKERVTDSNPGWSDFGGGTDKNEGFLDTATREGVEELTGFLGDKRVIRDSLKKYGTYCIDYKSDGHSTFRCHLFPLIYDPLLPFYYNNNHKVIDKYLSAHTIRQSKIFEKTEIRWFSFDELSTHMDEFRDFYQNIVKSLLHDKTKITKFVKTNNCFTKLNKYKKTKHKNIHARKSKLTRKKTTKINNK